MGPSPNLVTPRQTFIYLFLQYYLFLRRTFSRYLHQISAPQHSRSPLVTALKRLFPLNLSLSRSRGRSYPSHISSAAPCFAPIPLANQHSKSSAFSRRGGSKLTAVRSYTYKY